MEAMVDESQVEFYEENGYVQLLNVLTAEELDDIRRSLAEADSLTLSDRQHLSRANPEYEKLFVQKVNLWTVHDGIRRYVFNPKLAEIARRLSQSSAIRLWHDHALVKLPGDSKESPWHQDLPYWPMNEPGALSCWMALDDVDEMNGCMQFIPGSHKWGRYDPVDLIHPQALLEIAKQADPSRDMTPDIMRMPAGSCTFHHGLTFHYANANRSDKPRRAMVTIYMPDGTTFTGGQHVVTDGLDLKSGEPIAGEKFPVLA